jgi:hypothetical protein
MARLNEILVGRYARSLQKLFGIKGPVPVSTLAPEIMPVHGVASGVEARYLEGWNRFGYQQSQIAVAANNSQIAFRNPANSSAIAVFERISVGGIAADNPFLFIGASNADLATVFSLIQRLDPRGNPNSMLIASKTATALITQSNMQAFFPANGSFEYVFDEGGELPLLPGDRLIVCSNVVNQALNLSVIWRERILEESEQK